MKKRLLAAVLSLGLILAVFSGCANRASDFEYEYNYSLLGGIYVTRYTGSSTQVRIPRKMGNNSPPVTSIGRGAFENREDIISVVIPDGVADIGYDAFAGCTKLKNIAIPDSVAYIGRDAFSGCTSLTDAVFKAVTYSYDENRNDLPGEFYAAINGAGAAEFDYRVIEGGIEIIQYKGNDDIVYIPEKIHGMTVISIKAFVFWDSGMVEVYIPDTMTSIGEGVFFRCAGLTGAIIPDNVTDIGDFAFFGCVNLTEAVYKGVTYSITEIEDEEMLLGLPEGETYWDLPQEFYDAVNGGR